jgi:hypothetical protein
VAASGNAVQTKMKAMSRVSVELLDMHFLIPQGLLDTAGATFINGTYNMVYSRNQTYSPVFFLDLDQNFQPPFRISNLTVSPACRPLLKAIIPPTSSTRLSHSNTDQSNQSYRLITDVNCGAQLPKCASHSRIGSLISRPRGSPLSLLPQSTRSSSLAWQLKCRCRPSSRRRRVSSCWRSPTTLSPNFLDPARV